MLKKMCHRVTATIVIIVALALAITVSMMKNQPALLPFVMYVTRFFDVMLPILAVGALLKYLLCGNCSCHYHEGQEPCGKKEKK